MTSFITKRIVKKGNDMLNDEFNKFRHAKPADKDDPYFAYDNMPNGKRRKMKKKIPAWFPEEDQKSLKRAKKLAYSWDMGLYNKHGVTFGLSSVIGLIPEIGDVCDLAMALFVAWQCTRMSCKRPHGMVLKMLAYILIDFVIGLIPVFGDLADAQFRCNTKNVAMMEKVMMDAFKPEDMSIEASNAARLEPFEEDLGEDEKAHGQQMGVAGPTQPQQTHTRDGKGWGQWVGRRERWPDAEMGPSPATEMSSNRGRGGHRN